MGTIAALLLALSCSALVIYPIVRRMRRNGFIVAALPLALAFGVLPVSYTHLDVYKRQDLLRKGVVAAETSGKRLFTKNTGPCEHANGCIRTDACPVLEG